MTFDRETLCPTYQMIIGEAGESCAFYIADRLGMPKDMLDVAAVAAYGKSAADAYDFGKRNDYQTGGNEVYKRSKRAGTVIILDIKSKFFGFFLLTNAERSRYIV